MSVRKITKKSWQIDYIDAVTGKRIRKSGFKTKSEADTALAQAMVNNSKGITNVKDKNNLSTTTNNKEKQAWQ